MINLCHHRTMKALYCLIILVCISARCHALMNHRRSTLKLNTQFLRRDLVDSCEERYRDSTIDHFSFVSCCLLFPDLISSDLSDDSPRGEHEPGSGGRSPMTRVVCVCWSGGHLLVDHPLHRLYRSMMVAHACVCTIVYYPQSQIEPLHVENLVRNEA